MSDLLRSEIASADPVKDQPDAKRHDLIDRMAIDAREAARETTPRSPWWKRRRIGIPLSIAGAIALTGAAIFTPLQLWVNDTPVELDVEIPIIYTTDTGVDVKCRFGIYFGDPAHRTEADERLAAFVESHDWRGIGQRIYNEAIANPFVPGPDDDWEVDTQEIRDSFSFNRAIDLIWAEIPAELQQTGQSAGGASDCTGRLR